MLYIHLSSINGEVLVFAPFVPVILATQISKELIAVSVVIILLTSKMCHALYRETRPLVCATCSVRRARSAGACERYVYTRYYSLSIMCFRLFSCR